MTSWAGNVGESREPVGFLSALWLRGTWKRRAGMTVAAAALAVAATPVVLVAVGTYLPLRRQRDRRRGWQALSVAGGGVVLLWPSQTLFWRAWVWVLGFEGLDAAAVLGGTVVAVVTGALLGAAYFLADQRYREGVPVGGDIATEARIRAEGARRRRSASRRTRMAYSGGRPENPVMRKAVDLAAPPLVTKHGLVVGPFLRGDLTRFCRRGSLVLPLGSTEVKHLVVLGTTGTGKSEFVWRVAEHDLVSRVAGLGGQLVYLNAKQTAPEQSSAIRLSRIAKGFDVDVRALIRDHSGFDMLRGSISDQRGKLLAIERFGDDYWRHVSNILASLVLDLRSATRQPVSSLPQLVHSLNAPTLKQLAKEYPDAETLLDSLNSQAMWGALTRYASVALTLQGYLAGPSEGGWSWEDADVAVCDLPSGTDRQAAASLMRVMLLDLQQYLSSPRRPRDGFGKYLPVTVVLEELSALDDDPIIGRAVLDLMERGRSLNVRVIVVAQDDLGLGDERARTAILGSGTIAAFRVPARAEEVANMGGTYRRTESSGAYSGWIASGHDVGSQRNQYSFRVHPDELRQLGLGECWVMHQGRSAKAYTLQPPSFFDESPAPAELVEALYQAEMPAAVRYAPSTTLPAVPMQARAVEERSAAVGIAEVDEQPTARGWDDED